MYIGLCRSSICRFIFGGSEYLGISKFSKKHGAAQKPSSMRTLSDSHSAVENKSSNATSPSSKVVHRILSFVKHHAKTAAAFFQYQFQISRVTNFREKRFVLNNFFAVRSIVKPLTAVIFRINCHWLSDLLAISSPINHNCYFFFIIILSTAANFNSIVQLKIYQNHKTSENKNRFNCEKEYKK